MNLATRPGAVAPYTESHAIVCNASAERVYEIIRDSDGWPRIFEPCRQVRALARDGSGEHIEVTALVHGRPTTWQSRRRFLPQVYGIESTMLVPMPLVSSMATSWRVVQFNQQQCLLVLEHVWTLASVIAGVAEGVHDAAQACAHVRSAIDVNSRVELGNIKAAAEAAVPASPVPLEGHARHAVVCQADADTVYALIRHPSQWPGLFEACVSAQQVQSTPEGEIVRIEALQDGQRVTWNTRRRYFDAIRRIDYDLPVPMPFLSAMSGQWRVVPLAVGQCLLTVDRHWTLVPDVHGIREGVDTVVQAAAIVERYVQDNAHSEMLAIQARVGRQARARMQFTSRVHLPHAPHAVYALLADAAGWPDLLPHCLAVDIAYDDGEYQEFTMTIGGAHGHETFRSIRRCDSQALTVQYFQPSPPKVLRQHHGQWQLRSAPGGCEALVTHDIVLDEVVCDATFGAAEPRAHAECVRGLIERNSHATLQACAARLAQQATATAAETAPGQVCHE